MLYIGLVLLLTNLICFNVSDWLCGCDCDQEQLHIALVCVSLSLSMIVRWFMFVLYIDVFHFLKQCCCVELEECICMYSQIIFCTRLPHSVISAKSQMKLQIKDVIMCSLVRAITDLMWCWQMSIEQWWRNY